MSRSLVEFLVVQSVPVFSFGNYILLTPLSGVGILGVIALERRSYEDDEWGR